MCFKLSVFSSWFFVTRTQGFTWTPERRTALFSTAAVLAVAWVTLLSMPGHNFSLAWPKPSGSWPDFGVTWQRCATKPCQIHITAGTDKWRNITFMMQVLPGWGLLNTPPLLSMLHPILTSPSSGSLLYSWCTDRKRIAQVITFLSQIRISDIPFLPGPHSRQDESCCLWWHLLKQLFVVSSRHVSSPPSRSLKVQIPTPRVGAF